jgi:hypothetical protein
VDAHLVNVGMKDAVAEADGGRFVWVVLGKLDVHLPPSAFVGACQSDGGASGTQEAEMQTVNTHSARSPRSTRARADPRVCCRDGQLTVFGPAEEDVELVDVIIHERNRKVAHHAARRERVRIQAREGSNGMRRRGSSWRCEPDAGGECRGLGRRAHSFIKSISRLLPGELIG